MSRVVKFFTVLLFLTSCCFVAPPHHHLRDQEVVDETEIFNIVIKSWGEQKYSGLLAIKSGSKGVRYIMLDATGIKLLESEIGSENQKVIDPPLGPLAGSSLNNFLSKALKRMFIEMPDELPCMYSGLSQFCYNIYSESSWEKVYKIWPFSIWRAEKKNPTITTQYLYSYSQPWIGVSIELREVNHGN